MRVPKFSLLLLVPMLMLLSQGARATALNVEPEVASGASGIEAQFVSRLKETFSQRMDIPADSFDVRAEKLVFFPAVTPDVLAKSEILDVMGIGTSGAQRIDGLFTLSVTLRGPDKSVREHQVSGLLSVVGPVWVTTSIINRGHVIAPSDLQIIRLPWSQLATGVALTRKDALLGRASRNLLSSGTPLFGSFLETAPSVQTGDTVELTVQSGPGVLIRSRAVAKQAGRVGDFIRVEQSDTRKPLQALVTGEKSVEVQL